jgi:hypothetical protein
MFCVDNDISGTTVHPCGYNHACSFETNDPLSVNCPGVLLTKLIPAMIVFSRSITQHGDAADIFPELLLPASAPVVVWL